MKEEISRKKVNVRLQVSISQEEYNSLIIIKNYMSENRVIDSDSDYAFLKYIIQQFIEGTIDKINKVQNNAR